MVALSIPQQTQLIQISSLPQGEVQDAEVYALKGQGLLIWNPETQSILFVLLRSCRAAVLRATKLPHRRWKTKSADQKALQKKQVRNQGS